MKIGWELDVIGWACAQPFPTLATPLASKNEAVLISRKCSPPKFDYNIKGISTLSWKPLIGYLGVYINCRSDHCKITAAKAIS